MRRILPEQELADMPSTSTRKSSIVSEIPLSLASESHLNHARLFLGSVQAVLSLGVGDNPWRIEAVLSCLPDVNGTINTLVSKCGIAHHDYFLLDDNDALQKDAHALRDPNEQLAPTLCFKHSESLSLPSTSSSDDLQPPQPSKKDLFGHFDGSSEQLKTALQFIWRNLSGNRNVLVHCDGGVLRSPATVISYLMVYEGKSLAEAKAVVTVSRPEVHIRPLEDQLSTLESTAPLLSCVGISMNESLNTQSGGCVTSFESAASPLASELHGRTFAVAPTERFAPEHTKAHHTRVSSSSSVSDDDNLAQVLFEMPVVSVPHLMCDKCERSEHVVTAFDNIMQDSVSGVSYGISTTLH